MPNTQLHMVWYATPSMSWDTFSHYHMPGAKLTGFGGGIFLRRWHTTIKRITADAHEK